MAILDAWGGSLGMAVVDSYLSIGSSAKQNDNSPQSYFFRPFKDKEDSLRIFSPISAPIPFLFVAAQMALACLIDVCGALLSALSFDKDSFSKFAKASGKNAGYCILLSVLAVISPVVALIDVAGSLLNTYFGSGSNDKTSDSAAVGMPIK